MNTLIFVYCVIVAALPFFALMLVAITRERSIGSKTVLVMCFLLSLMIGRGLGTKVDPFGSKDSSDQILSILHLFSIDLFWLSYAVVFAVFFFLICGVRSDSSSEP